MSELVMTAALWRADGADIEAIAADLRSSGSVKALTTDDTCPSNVDGMGAHGEGISTSPLKVYHPSSSTPVKAKGKVKSKGKGKGRGAAASGRSPLTPDRGGLAGTGAANIPHVALAARIVARDPDRKVVLGERIPYILMEVRASAAYSGEGVD